MSLSFGQLKGEIATDKRPLLQPFDFEIVGSKNAILVFNITVNEKGDVVTCELDKMATTGYSTPNMVKGKNKIKAELKFVADTMYPQFHRGTVTITVQKAD
ncbi:hypothetical protein DNU06_10665 [Putridiphycobacter roseus]|uniref:Uncharacterized protein n=2 Tax=Putridiphycobacter roseus TaxID=2219161 RepID=A0A2W1NFC0_9FLAO|nr:hypothetical protein DNU06_10665 [Putridiphycobacter roseus]